MHDDLYDLEIDNDEARESAQERGIMGDGFDFFGQRLRPITAGTWALMERTRNGIITGNAHSLLHDAAAFVLLHIDDDDAAQAARRAAERDWTGYVVRWLDETPQAHAKLIAFSDQIRRAREDYDAILTRDLESVRRGKHGGHIG